jgi:hypothetical protein
MSRKDAVVLASRTLAVLLTVCALGEASSLPGYLHSFLHYLNYESRSASTEYLRHYYLITLGFNITRVIGFSLMAMFLRRCGPDVEEMLLPGVTDEDPAGI